MTRVRRRWLVSLLLLCAAALLAASRVGYWLEIDEPLQHARAIVVLGGQVPFRAHEAAQLYQAGWAPEIWLTKGSLNAQDRALEDLGFHFVSEEEISRKVLLKLGVPETAIKTLPDYSPNTLAEVHSILRFEGSDAASPIIIVTSKPHTRRVRLIWNSQTQRPLIVRYTPYDPYLPGRWWASSTDGMYTFREIFGIANAWAGFPLAPKNR